MTNPLHADHYADRAVQQRVTVLENVQLARDTYRLRFEAPQLARQIVPGQFVMIRLAGCNDPLLGRPLALYDTVLSPSGEPIAIDVVYLVVGKLTSRLAKVSPGQTLDVWGPLGNGFPPTPAEHLIMVAGGIGQTPFPALAQEFLGSRTYGSPPRSVPRAGRVTLCYGARSADYLAGVEDFERLGISVRISTDDGSQGHHGLVTDLLGLELARVSRETDVTPQNWEINPPPLQNGDPAELMTAYPGTRVVCCGPEKMMEQVAKISALLRIPCQVSLETPMACGIGICFSCVAKVRDESGNWDYKRTCVEGPVFEAEKIAW
ncbi:MAG: dihydroorotate dehydrogenase electron transfer subunit [Planctomycetia bacterium]|nr:dihydroorotate dehydrogenase electron transfer subunit [Planctomycetia bacterium]